MLSVAQALTHVLQPLQPLTAETVSLDQAVGRVLAQPIVASSPLPNFANSSMDGYVVRAADVHTVPVKLKVIADIPAGTNPTCEIISGTAARIMTGAKIPNGGDAVVPVEATDQAPTAIGRVTPDHISILESVSAGAYIRLIGEDVQAGEKIFDAGKYLRPYDVGALAALGATQLSVVRRPRVALLTTGDELVPPQHTPASWQVRDINTHTLTALITKYGGEVLSLGIVRDQFEDVHAALLSAVAQQADLILSSAGVSVGAYDVVKTAVEREGALTFWRVNMRPGKPVAFGQVRGVPFLGLPGNPVSAIVAFEIFVRPALLKLGGHVNLTKPALQVKLTAPLASDGRETYLRAVVHRAGEELVATSAGGQGSNIISALAKANALVIIPAGIKNLAAGDVVTAWLLDETISV